MISKILAAIGTIKEIIDLIKGAFALYKKAKREGWVTEGQEIVRKVNTSKTREERKALAKSIAKHISSL